jgi:hypothetical protein
MRAAFVEREAGNLDERVSFVVLSFFSRGTGGNVLDSDTTAVIEEKDVDAHQPAAHGPDGIAGG